MGNSGTITRVPTQSLAEMLRQLREQKGSSLRGTAKELGVDPSFLSRLERGKKPASGQLLMKAAQYYNVPVEQLEMASGAVPADVVKILQDHPDLVERIREEYGGG
jgi:transcriptional regulator with XRE-family HTH domain